MLLLCSAQYRQRQLLQVASVPAVLVAVQRFTGYTASGLCSAPHVVMLQQQLYLHNYPFLQAMIEAGAAGVHFEDQLSSEKKCGHLGGALPPLLPCVPLLLRLQTEHTRVDNVFQAK
jgi:Isocitrate lyase family